MKTHDLEVPNAGTDATILTFIELLYLQLLDTIYGPY